MTAGIGRRAPVIGRAAAKAPGTCGELAQGILSERDFHVTCPIDLYATATVEASFGRGAVHGPTDCPKAIAAAHVTLDYLNRADVDIRLHLDSPLPRGKGMASSTADVAATIGATALALGRGLGPTEIAGLALRVEPSDGLMFPGVALFDHRLGSQAEGLGPAPAMRVIILDFGGSVDTVKFNGEEGIAPTPLEEECWRSSISLIRHGLQRGDLRLVGEGATMSARLVRRGPLSRHLSPVLGLMSQTGALGISLAHSGTVMGLLFPDEEVRAKEAVRSVRRQLPAVHSISSHRMVGGGVIPIEASRNNIYAGL